MMTSNKVLPWVKSKIIYKKKKKTLSKLFTSIELLWFLTQNNIRVKVFKKDVYIKAFYSPVV